VSVVAIGDLHGCLGELEVLLDYLRPSRADTLIFLGDYVDRGPSVRPLIERLLRLREEGPATIFLRGNHEDMLLDYLGYAGRYGAAYLGNGGTATLKSYGIAPSTSGAAAAAMLPPAHLQFLLDLQMTHRYEQFLFVHAGVRPDVPLAEQSEEDMLWIRDEFLLQPHGLPYVVVFGHTPDREARIELPQRIGLDTGIVYGNKLSSLDLTGRRLLQIARGAGRVVARDLAPDFAAAGL
jgi:diadenosine tetraphosphatase ApaH/serine/threonine PP2A family protein phosphatase